jgi:L-iditol 2-dehydrogenase
MTRTRAVACAPDGKTRFESRSLNAPGPGEMVIRLRVSGLCGTDLWKLEHRSAPDGSVLGHEVVGDVAAVGPGAVRFRTGDRIVVPHHVACGACDLCARGGETQCAVFRENLLDPGGFSEHVLIRERAVRLAARRVPDGVSEETAVFLEPAACVLRGVERAGLTARSSSGGGPDGGAAAVLGAGSMGLLHLLVLGAVRPDLKVIVADRMPERLRRAEDLGAWRACLPEAAGAAVREATRGLGAEAVFDTVGGAAVLTAALGLTRPGGVAVLFAHAPEGERAGFDLNDFFKHERRVVATYSGALREQEEVFRLIAERRLDPSPLVTHRLPLDRFEEAVRLARERQALKVLLVPAGAAAGRP